MRKIIEKLGKNKKSNKNNKNNVEEDD